MRTEAAIKRTLTRLQKLVMQYYDENPGILDRGGTRDEISYYGSAVVGISYNEFTDKWENVARITLKGNDDDYKTYYDICSPIDGKPIEHASIKGKSIKGK